MLNVGLLGCGRISRVHADSVTVHPRARLARVYDPITAAAQTLGSQFDADWTTDVAAVIDDPSIDAVVVASPTSTHVELLTRAVTAGKSVLCEKPIDLDLARVDACRAEIGDLTERVMVGFNRRFDPTFRDIRFRVAAGEIGTLEQLVITSRDPAPPPPGYVAGSGGLFRDMSIHDFDMARFFLDDLVSVTAAGANVVSDEIREAGDIDSAMVLLQGRNGTLCSIVNSRHCAFGYDQRLEAFGELGMLSAANQLPTGVRFSGGHQTEAASPYVNFFLDRYTPAYRAEMDHFVTAIETGAPFSPGFDDGRAALVLADAANQSLLTGTTVAVQL